MRPVVERQHTAERLVRLIARALDPRSGMKGGLRTLRALVTDRHVSLEELLEAVVHHVQQCLDADRCTLYLVDHARRELVSRATVLPEIAEIRVRFGEGVTGWVAQHLEVVNVPTRHAGFREAARRFDALTGYRSYALLAAPVRNPSGDLLGVLQVLNPRDGEAFQAHHEQQLVQLCQSVADLLGTSSLGSQLYPPQRQPLDYHFNHIVGSSPPMLEVYRRVRAAAPTSATVLITGETGTGKELVARAIHDNSPRRDGPFIKVDCAALPDALIESELFGHTRGAFTGADQDKPGRVELAEGGTLLLDEIGELPLPLQGRLLRFLQDRTYQRLGDPKLRRADVRFVAATHRDLPERVRDGTFRQDLYYRLRVVPIALPALRDRGAVDLDRLIDHFVFVSARQHGLTVPTLPSSVRQQLHAHPWPGNVRELLHVLEAAVVLGGGEIGRDLLPMSRDGSPDPSGGFRSTLRPLRELEAHYVRWALEQCGGNQTQTAKVLEIGRNTLARKLDEI